MKFLHLLDMTSQGWLKRKWYQNFTWKYISTNKNTPFIVINDAGLFSDGNFLKDYAISNLKLFINVKGKDKITDILNQIEASKELITFRPTIICLSEVHPGYLANALESCGISKFTIFMCIHHRSFTHPSSIFSDVTWCNQYNRVMYYKNTIVTSFYTSMTGEYGDLQYIDNESDNRISCAKIIKLCRKLI